MKFGRGCHGDDRTGRSLEAVAVGLFEVERRDLVDGVVEVVHASGASLFHQQSTGTLSSSLLLQSLLHPLSPHPPAQKHTVQITVLYKNNSSI